MLYLFSTKVWKHKKEDLETQDLLEIINQDKHLLMNSFQLLQAFHWIRHHKMIHKVFIPMPLKVNLYIKGKTTKIKTDLKLRENIWIFWKNNRLEIIRNRNKIRRAFLARQQSKDSMSKFQIKVKNYRSNHKLENLSKNPKFYQK